MTHIHREKEQFSSVTEICHPVNTIRLMQFHICDKIIIRIGMHLFHECQRYKISNLFHLSNPFAAMYVFLIITP